MDAQFRDFEEIYKNTGTTFGPPLDGTFLDFGLSFDQMFVCEPHDTYDNLTIR